MTKIYKVVAILLDLYYWTTCIIWKLAAIDLQNTNIVFFTHCKIVFIDFEYQVLFSVLGVISLSPNVYSYYHSHNIKLCKDSNSNINISIRTWINISLNILIDNRFHSVRIHFSILAGLGNIKDGAGILLGTKANEWLHCENLHFEVSYKRGFS